MGKESHIQWAIYCVDNSDYYISLKKDTLDEVKKWNIIKSKIVYFSDKNIRELVQKKLLITLLTEDERKKNLSETRIIHSDDKVWLKISKKLLDILIEENSEDFEYRYNMGWDKIHFLIDNSERPFSEKSWFDSTFRFCEKSNKKQPTTWDLFDSEYIDVYNPQ